MGVSKLPDLSEITSMAGKLFNDVKRSVTEIAKDYQEKHKCPSDVENSKSTGDEAHVKVKAESPAEKPAKKEPVKSKESVTKKGQDKSEDKTS